jgi:uncharacterized membrane protein
MDDPWSWIAAGWVDLTRAPLASLTYGLIFVIAGMAGTVGLWAIGLESAVPVAAAGFALVGPVLALGLYEVSRLLEEGRPITFDAVFRTKAAEPMQLVYMSLLLGLIFLAWFRIAMLLYAAFAHFNYLPLDDFLEYALQTPDGLALVIVGTVVGGFLALLVFATSALAVPMLLDRHVDVITASGISIQTVIRHPGPMLLWAWLIAVLVAVGFLTFGVGLIVVFPLLGYATWHAYCTLIGSAR